MIFVLRDQRRLSTAPEPESEAGSAAEVIALAARAAGRRAVVRRPRELTPPVPRPRSVVPAGPVAQRVLRRRLRERLDEAVNADGDGSERGFSIAVVEVEAASSGHPVGRERLLTALGSRLADVTRPSDLVVRPAPSRFVLVLGGVRDSYGLAAARRRISDVLSRPVLIDGRPVRSNVSVGLVPAGPHDTVDGLLTRLGAAATRERRSARRLRSVGALDPGS